MLYFHFHRIKHLAVGEKLIDWTEDSTKHRRPSRKPSTAGISRWTTRCARRIELGTAGRCRGHRNTYHAMSYVSYVSYVLWKRRKPRYVSTTFWLAQKLHLWLNGIHWHGTCSASAIAIFQKGCILSGCCSRAWNWSVFESSWSSRALMKFSQALFAFMLHSILCNIVFLEFTRMMSRDSSAPKSQKDFGCSVKCCHMKNQNVLGRRLGACRSHWHTSDLSHSILGTAEQTWNDNVEPLVPILCQQYLVK